MCTPPLFPRLGSHVSVLRLSQPLKQQYAKVGEKKESVCGREREYIEGGRKRERGLLSHECYCTSQDHGLDLGRLLDSSSYKEEHRKSMIRWGEEQREKDPHCFCRQAVAEADRPIWLVCDARRPTDMEFFTTRYRTVTARVVASDGERRARGWVWCDGVDDAASECALDGYQCQFALTNEGDGLALGQQLEEIRDAALGKLPPQTSSED